MAAPGTDHDDEAENRGRAVRREVRATSLTAVIRTQAGIESSLAYR